MKKLTDRSEIRIEDPGLSYEPEEGNAGPCEWSVVEVARAAKTLWGDLAVTAIAWGALAANLEGDMGEYRFWYEVFDHLRADDPQAGFGGMMLPVSRRLSH